MRRILFLALLVTTTSDARATPEVYEMECAFCHVDDTPTCAGCHNHHLDLVAETDAVYYTPGEPVSVTLSGAELPGWIRAILYDHEDTEVDRSTGPTGTGDDGHGPAVADSIITPVILEGTAPREVGTYTWRAAYFGVFDIREAGHGEKSVPVTIAVVDTSQARSSWGRVKSRYDH